MEVNISSLKNLKVRVNNQITSSTVRVIDADGEMAGVMPVDKAIELANNQDLDLIEISPQAKPPVCKVMDYGKYKYEQSKKQSQVKKSQKKIELKEIKFRPNIDTNDYNIKVKHITEFLEKGHKVKVTMRFRGREMAHNELGFKLLKKVIAELEGIAKVDNHPKLEGRQMGMMLSPDKTAKTETKTNEKPLVSDDAQS